jgi:hypothetical protein
MGTAKFPGNRQEDPFFSPRRRFLEYNRRIDISGGGEEDMNRIILGIQITNRLTKAPEVQKLFTQYGCNIKTRLGLHDVNADSCSPSGLVLLEMFGKEEEILAMEKALKAIEGIQVQKMIFV